LQELLFTQWFAVRTSVEEISVPVQMFPPVPFRNETTTLFRALSASSWPFQIGA